MLALAAAAAHGSVQSSEVLAIIASIVIAAFWRFFLKLGIAILIIGFLILLFGGASAIFGLHG
jgi:intracellular septation protein A